MDSALTQVRRRDDADAMKDCSSFDCEPSRGVISRLVFNVAAIMSSETTSRLRDDSKNASSR